MERTAALTRTGLAPESNDRLYTRIGARGPRMPDPWKRGSDSRAGSVGGGDGPFTSSFSNTSRASTEAGAHRRSSVPSDLSLPAMGGTRWPGGVPPFRTVQRNPLARRCSALQDGSAETVGLEVFRPSGRFSGTRWPGGVPPFRTDQPKDRRISTISRSHGSAEGSSAAISGCFCGVSRMRGIPSLLGSSRSQRKGSTPISPCPINA